MGLLNNIFGTKPSEEVSTIKEIENRDLLYISYDENIPRSPRGLFVSFTIRNGRLESTEEDKNFNDPSAIYIHLPISEDFNIPSPPYWPSYIDLTPGQRYLYLNWLRNVDAPINIGYVFLYYYGLERQLLIGNFDKAFEQIIRLRNVHKNKSFLDYSESALIHSCILKDRLDLLLDLNKRTEISGFSNAQFLLAYNLKYDLTPQNLADIMWKSFYLSRKAMKDNRDNFEQIISDVLTEKYGSGSFPICNYDISKTRTVTESRFCNYSFPREIQNVEITDFYQCKGLMEDVEIIFKLAYEKYKLRTAAERKAGSTKKSEEELEAARLKRNSSRYKKLLNDKKITAEEYEFLMQKNQPKQ